MAFQSLRAEPSAAKPRRRWKQFGLSTLLILTTASAVVMALYNVPVHRLRQQRQAVEKIEAMSGATMHARRRISYIIPSDSRLQQLARKIYGDDFYKYGRLAHVHIGNRQMPVSDADLRPLGTLDKLTGLDNFAGLGLDFADISPAGIEHLKGLDGLMRLSLEHSTLADGTLTSLQQFKHLRALSLTYVPLSVDQLHELAALAPVDVFLTLNTPLTVEHVEAIAACRNIRVLTLIDPMLPPHAWTKLAELPNLTTLQFESTLDTPEPLPVEAFLAVGRQSQLKSLVFTRQTGTDEAWAMLPSLANLEQLQLEEIEMSPAACQAIGNQPLRELHLISVSAREQGWAALPEMDSLKSLSLKKSELPPAALQAVARQREVHTLDLDESFMPGFPPVSKKPPRVAENEHHVISALLILENLGHLIITESLIHPDGQYELRDSLPNCNVQYSTRY